MNKIDHYIFKIVLSCFLTVIMIFSVLFFIFTYISKLSRNNGILNVYDIILEILYQLPTILYVLLPACAMLGALMGLNLLANNSEIIILRASGKSNTQIAKGVILLGIIGSIITVIFGGYIAPALQKKSNLNQYDVQNIWIKTTDSIMHIDRIDFNKKIAYNVRKFIIKDSDLKEIKFAKKAQYITDNIANAYNTQNIFLPTKNIQKEISITNNFKQDKWKNLLPLSIAKIITINDKNHLNLNQLIKFMLSNTESKDNFLRLKFWQQIFHPVSLMVMTLLSVPLNMGSNRSSSFVTKLLLGSLFGFIFFIFNQILGPITLILQLPPIFGAAAPTLIGLALLIYLFIKTKEI